MGRRVPRNLALASAVVALTAACTIQFERTVRGSGAAASELRAAEGFAELDVGGGLDVTVELGSGPLVVVHADENLLPYVHAVTSGSRLRVWIEDGYRLTPAPRVEVRAPELSSVSRQGSGSTALAGLSSDAFAIATTGSGDLTASGTVGALRVTSVGSGDVDLFGLRADRVEVRATGSGDVDVFARSALTVVSSGSGEVTYRGGASAVVDRVSGSGSVRRGD